MPICEKCGEKLKKEFCNECNAVIQHMAVYLEFRYGGFQNGEIYKFCSEECFEKYFEKYIERYK